MTAELTPADYAYLIILNAENRTVTNNDLSKRHDVRLISPDYEKLNAEGLVVSETKPRPYRHTITQKGRKLLEEPLAVDDQGKKRTASEKLLWAALVARQNGGAAEEPAPARLEDQIRAAYTKLTGGPGEWLDLTALRPLFVDVSKAELDRALVRLLGDADVRLEPEPFGHRIGAEERKAAVHVGGEDRHKLAIGLP